MPFCFFFNDTATTEIYTLSLHDALPISRRSSSSALCRAASRVGMNPSKVNRSVGIPAIEIAATSADARSEEHTSELQSHLNLVCRLLLEKKKKTNTTQQRITDMQ